MGNQVSLDAFATTESISRVHGDDLSRSQFIKQYFLPNKPVIIQGANASWPVAGWELDDVISAIPDQLVSVRNNASGRLFDPETMGHQKAEMQLHEFIRCIQSGENTTPLYMAQTNLDDLVEHVADYVPRFHYLRRLDYLLQTNIWIGTPGLATPAHFDFAHNFFHQISGHKQITLFSPEDSARLYPNPSIPMISLVDVGSPDANRFPDFAAANPIQFVVNPGDSVFIPCGWWHYIASTYDNNISINQWFLRMWSRNTQQLGMIPPLVGHTLKHLWKQSRS
jgi:ribosomal protein L16 Arg81 hydroxylase